MNQTEKSQFLLILNCPEQDNLIFQIFSVKDKAQIHLVRVNQLTIHGYLFVLVVLKISDEGDLFIREKILQVIPQIKFNLESLELYALEIHHYPYILTLVGQLSPFCIIVGIGKSK